MGFAVHVELFALALAFLAIRGRNLGEFFLRECRHPHLGCLASIVANYRADKNVPRHPTGDRLHRE